MGSTPNGRIRIFFLCGLRHWMKKEKKIIILNLSEGLRQPPFSWVQVVFFPHRGEEKECVTLETIRGLVPKCLPQMFLG